MNIVNEFYENSTLTLKFQKVQKSSIITKNKSIPKA
jgi:hypothetical protein